MVSTENLVDGTVKVKKGHNEITSVQHALVILSFAIQEYKEIRDKDRKGASTALFAKPCDYSCKKTGRYHLHL